MSAMILKSLLMIFVLLVISGCSEKVYVDRPVEVKVPVKCEVPKVICTAGQATYTEEIREMRLCIERYKQAAAVCSK
jgi:hypothetical protein